MPDRPSLAVVPTYASMLELAHLLAIITHAARLLDEDCRDVDANILRAHGAELAAGREWPGTTIRSTLLGERQVAALAGGGQEASKQA